METTRSLRKRVIAPPKPGAPFQIDRAFERSERIRLDLPGKGEDKYHFSEWDNIKFMLAGWFVILAIPASVLLVAWGFVEFVRAVVHG